MCIRDRDYAAAVGLDKKGAGDAISVILLERLGHAVPHKMPKMCIRDRKKIVEMIENSEVETLIVKDLSRLGREYLQVGQLTELYFPEKGVRFIAVNDSVDSLVESSNDFNPIRNWANELHAKDTSKKVRAIKKMTAGAP